MVKTSRTECIERTERPWGWYETISQAPGNLIKRIHVDAGKQLSLQKHHHRAEHWVVTKGSAHITLDEKVFVLHPGECCDIAVLQVHRLSNPSESPVEIVEVQFGTDLREDDIVRLQDDFGRDKQDT
jgi:mannose-6-phosphate isomerase